MYLRLSSFSQDMTLISQTLSEELWIVVYGTRSISFDCLSFIQAEDLY
jgi:hypothetical protein